MCVDCCILEKQGLYIGRANMWMCDKSSILIKNCIAFSNHYHIIFNQMNKHIAEISRKYNWGIIHTDFIFMLRCLFKLLNFSRCKVIISLKLKKKKGEGFEKNYGVVGWVQENSHIKELWMDFDDCVAN